MDSSHRFLPSRRRAAYSARRFAFSALRGRLNYGVATARLCHNGIKCGNALARAVEVP